MFLVMIPVKQLANRDVLELIPYEPGKPVEDVARELGLSPNDIIKLASNENPLGPSPAAVAVMQSSLERSNFYPDAGGFYLREAIASHLGLERSHIILGCGSNEIIEFLFHAFTKAGGGEALASRYAFSIYRLTAQMLGVAFTEAPDKDFTHDLDALLAAITPKTRLVFVANPNNPTGTRVSNESLDRFVRALPDHVVLALDEAYYEYLDDPPASVQYVREGRAVILLRTFSKIYGLAGLRIGYGIAAPELIDVIQRTRQPFNTCHLAQEAALASLGDAEHVRKSKLMTDEGRRQLEDAFMSMKLSFVHSCTNFVFVNVRNSDAVFRALLKKGIIVRPMGSYRLPEWIRVTIGTTSQNERFLEQLKKVLRR